MEKIGLIAGGGDFPVLFANVARKKGLELVCVALKDEASPALEDLVNKIYWVGLGEVKKTIEILRSEDIKKAVMLGKVTKTKFFKNRPAIDEGGDLLLKLAQDKRDLTLLKTAARVLRLYGIRLVSCLICLKENLARKGCLTLREPTKREWEDIYFGFKIAKRLSDLDIGQTVVIKEKVILAVEAIEGTDEAIKRGGELGAGDVVVVKTARPNQDIRFDIPVIGPDTIRSLIEARASVLALEKNKTLVTEKELLTRLANDANISIVVV